MDIRRTTIELLATPHTDTRHGAPYLPRVIAERSGCRPHQAYETLWRLVGEGLVFLDASNHPNGPDNWHWRLSQDGIAAASGGSWEPRDREGYLRRIRRQTPELDPVALVYLDEALRAFNARCYLSASVMLGTAAEQVFLGLARAAVIAEPGRGEPVKRALDSRHGNQRTRFDKLRKLLEPLRSKLPEGFVDQLTLDAIADLLRVARNDAGHPTGVQIDEDTARAHLVIAASYLGKMTKLRTYFESKSPEPDSGGAGSAQDLCPSDEATR